MSEVKVDKISPRSGTTFTLGDSGDTFDVPSGATLDVTGATVTGLSAGKVLQVVTLQYNTIETHSAGASWQNTGLSLAITPASTSNKVLVLISAAIGTATYGFANVVRDSTALNQGTATGTRIACTTGVFHNSYSTGMETITLLDSPSTTSATTYLLAIYGYSGNTVYLNRSYLDDDAVYTPRPSSSITLMEIEG